MANKKVVLKQGFTLVELSIVIIIIGFLIAGITGGTSLVKQATLNSVITDFQTYQTAYNSFYMRYSQIPGDIDFAFALWGTNCAVDSDSCNGNNNAVIDSDNGVELPGAWKHLSLAGMVSQGFPLIEPFSEAEAGVNMPTSKVASAGYSMALGDDDGIWYENDGTPLFNDGITNGVFIGTFDNWDTLDNGAITGKDAFYIDQKLDDGTISASGAFTGADTGKVRTFEGYENNFESCLTYTTVYSYVVTSDERGCVTGIALN